MQQTTWDELVAKDIQAGTLSPTYFGMTLGGRCPACGRPKFHVSRSGEYYCWHCDLKGQVDTSLLPKRRRRRRVNSRKRVCVSGSSAHTYGRTER